MATATLRPVEDPPPDPDDISEPTAPLLTEVVEVVDELDDVLEDELDVLLPGATVVGAGVWR